jgi:hypothetical protein
MSRAAVVFVLGAVVAGALVALACTPSPKDGQLRCNHASKACPDGYYCATDDACWLVGHLPTGNDLGVDDGDDGGGGMPGDDLGGVGSPDLLPGMHTVTLVVSGPAAGKVTGPNLQCGTPSSMGTMCTTTVADGTAMTLVESPDIADGAVFVGWGGGCSGNNTTCMLTVSADTTVDATFSFARTLSVTILKSSSCGTANSADSYVSTSVSGLTPMNCADCGVGKTCSATFFQGTTTVITFTPGLPTPNTTSCTALSGVPTIGPISGACTINNTNSTQQLSCTVTMDGDKSITVNSCQQSG